MTKESDAKRILVCGDVYGRWKALYNRLNKIIKTAGNFDALFCIGDFFGTDSTEIKKLLSGELKSPLPTYIVTDVSETNKEFITNNEGFELCENVKFMGTQGLYTMYCGLRIVYVADKNIDENFSQDSPGIKSLIDDDQLTGIDLLLTTQWPKDYLEQTSLASDPPIDHPNNESCSAAISNLAYYLKPRYHFSAGKGIYYERPPYRNHRVLLEKNYHVTRFMGLAEVKNPSNAKYLCALSLTPMDKMDNAELCAQPGDVTENPFINLVQHNLDSMKERQVQTDQFFYDVKDKKRKNNRRGDYKNKRSKNDQFPQQMERKMNSICRRIGAFKNIFRM